MEHSLTPLSSAPGSPRVTSPEHTAELSLQRPPTVPPCPSPTIYRSQWLTQVPAQRGLMGPWALLDAKSHRDSSRPPAPLSISESLGFGVGHPEVAPCWNKTVTLEQSRQRWHAKPIAWQTSAQRALRHLPPAKELQALRQPWSCGSQESNARRLRERKRHSQKGELTRPRSHRKSVVELEHWRAGSWASHALLRFC